MQIFGGLFKVNGMKHNVAYFHLPGLFEFCDLYKEFLTLYKEHRDYFYDWIEIASIYGAPSDCLWGGGRVGFGDDDISKMLTLLKEHGISARLTFSNSLLKEEHLDDKKCNSLCSMLNEYDNNGVIVHSDILFNYLYNKYPNLYYVSSTTKVITDFDVFLDELNRKEFRYVVPDFRLNKSPRLSTLSQEQKDKVEFLCNECCSISCVDREKCYENVSHKSLGDNTPDHICKYTDEHGYRFSKAMENPMFIGIDDIKNVYIPMGYSNFKIEGRGLGSAMVLEFLLYYLTKPECQLKVRESIYLDSMLDLF